MTRKLFVFLFLLAWTLGADAAPTEMRTWTDTQGREVTARAIRLTDDGVVLERENGTTITVLVRNLCEADGCFVLQHFMHREHNEAILAVPAVIGWIISVVGGIWFLGVACRQSNKRGLGCLFIPFVSLVFLIIHWRDAAKPFGVSLLGALIAVVGPMLLMALGA